MITPIDINKRVDSHNDSINYQLKNEYMYNPRRDAKINKGTCWFNGCSGTKAVDVQKENGLVHVLATMTEIGSALSSACAANGR